MFHKKDFLAYIAQIEQLEGQAKSIAQQVAAKTRDASLRNKLSELTQTTKRKNKILLQKILELLS